MPLIFGVFAHLVNVDGEIELKDTRPKMFCDEQEARAAFAEAVAHYQRVEVELDDEGIAIDRSQDLDAPKDLTVVDANEYEGVGDW
jgi:hypothetical protein